MIALVTDSVSQMPLSMAQRLGVEVVPVIIAINGVQYREGVDLTADDFWALFADGNVPNVSTSQPSPGEMAAVYRRLLDDGADEIVSIHVGAEHSGTVNSARVAADLVGGDVHVVDTGTASFGVSCCVWEAAEVIAASRSASDAADRARAVAPTVGTAFIIQAFDFARRGGRLADTLPAEADGVMVLAGTGGDVEVIGMGNSVDDLCDQMVAPFLADGRPIRAGVCLADEATIQFTEGIEQRLRDADIEVDLVRYRVGPSVGAQTGPGTAGGFWYPIAP